MNFVYDALLRAEKEQKIERAWLPKFVAPPQQAAPIEPLPVPDGVAKQFAMLRQNVVQANEEQGTQLITITSSVPGEGCSTIAYYLSLLLSQSTNGIHPLSNDGRHFDADNGAIRINKKGVLLIDANFEQPRLHQLFGVTLNPGLMEYVRSKNSSSSIFTKTARGIQARLITSGKYNSDCPDPWSSEKIKYLFYQLREQFRFIIVDAPPIIGHPETIALSKLTDGVLLVVKADKTRLEVIEQARQQLKNAGVAVLAAVLNDRKYYIPEGIYKRL